MASPLDNASFHTFPSQSSTSSLLGESRFLPNRPISAGIDSITQGFRFAAPGRKPVAAGVGLHEGVGRERVVNNNVEMNAPNPRIVKVPVPIPSHQPMILSSTQTPPPPLPLVIVAPSTEEVERTFSPCPSPRLSDKGRNYITTEKRKRIDSSALSDTGDSIQPGGMPQINHGERRRSERPIAREFSTKDDSTIYESKRVEASEAELSDKRKPKKKRPDKPGGPYRHPIPPPFFTPQDRCRGTEVIVLDDDIKTEPGDTRATCGALERRGLGDSRNMGMGEPARYSESHPHREKIKVYTDQPTRHHALEQKDNNQRIGAKPSMTFERPDPSSLQSGARMKNDNSQFLKGSSCSSVILRKKRSENNSHDIEPPLQQFNILPIPQEIQEHGNTGEHKLLVALTTLTTEKQVLETRLHETMASLKAQSFLVETSERKNIELEVQVKTYKDTVNGLKKKMLGIQKFIDGLGNDYNMLNEKKLKLDIKLNEISRDKSELLKSLQEVKALAKKADGTAQTWGSSGTILKEAYNEIDKLNETQKFLYAQLSEKAGLLATERDRTQSLEVQIQEDRERIESVLATIQSGKIELVMQLTEIRETIEKRGCLDLMDKLAEARNFIEVKVEADGGATRDLLQGSFKVVEKLKDREVDAVECLIGVEKRINHTSDNIIGIFQETHQMNAESLLYVDGYISHLNSRIIDLEEKLAEMQGRCEVLLTDSVENKQLMENLEQSLKTSLERCDELSGQVENGRKTEDLLRKSISMLNQTIVTLETRPKEDLTGVETTKALKQKNLELEKECELTRNNFQDATASLQAKGSELENLRIKFEVLLIEHKEQGERIKGFEQERADFMARAEEQKMKERIEVETNANMFRQRETSKLNNQIKALEGQKEKLEADSRELRNVETDNATALWIAERKLKESEDENRALRRQKDDTANAYKELEERAKTLEKNIGKLKGAVTKGPGDKSPVTTVDLYEGLEPLKVDTTKATRAMKTFTESGGNFNTVSPGELSVEIFASDTNTMQAMQNGIPAEKPVPWDMNSPSLSPFTPPELILETQIDGDRTDKTLGPEGEIWSSFSRINDANFERYLFGDDDVMDVTDLTKDILDHRGVDSVTKKLLPDNPHTSTSRVKVIKKDSQDLQPRKNMAVKFTSKRRPPSMMLDGDDDEATMIDNFSDDAEANATGVSLLGMSNTYSAHVDSTHFTPKSRPTEEKNRKITAERYSFIPMAGSSNKQPKTPQRTDNSRGGLTDNGSKTGQHRTRKDRGKKHREDQEWAEEEDGTPKNSKGKEETPSMKKNLRSYKERKKGGKRFVQGSGM